MTLKYEETIALRNEAAARSFLSRFNSSVTEAFILRGSSMGLLFLMNLVLARNLGTREYGAFTYTLTAAGLIAMIVTFGLPTASMRFIAEYSEKEQWRYLKGIVVRSFLILLCVSIIAAIIVILIVNTLSFSNTIRESFWYVALLLPLISLGVWRSKAILGLHRIRESILPEEILLPLIVIIICFCFPVGVERSAILMYWFVFLMMEILGLWWLWYYMPKQAKLVSSEYKTSKWLKVSFPMVVGGTMQMVLNRADLLILGAIVDMNATGLYSAAARISLLCTFMLRVVDTAIAPMIAASYHVGKCLELRRIIYKGMILSTSAALPVFLVLILWSESILKLFGPGFQEASTLLRILAFGQLVNAVTGPVGFTLLMTGKERVFAIVVSISSMLNLCGNAFAIPLWQAKGAAIVSSASMIVMNLCLLFIAWRYFLSTSNEPTVNSSQ